MLTEVFQRARSGTASLAALLVVSFVLVFSGCATRQPSTVTTESPVIVKTPTPPPKTTPLAPKPSPSPGPALVPQPTPITADITTAVAQNLGPGFSILSITPTSLRLAEIPLSTRPAPSLFEESILLGKIRAALKTSPASQISFKNGAASISLPGDIAPASGAAIIEKLFSIDGVNEVRANFPNE